MKRRRAREKNPLAPYKAQILKWKRGMEEMNRRDFEERRKMTIEQKFDVLMNLMEFAKSCRAASGHPDVPDKATIEMRRRFDRYHRSFRRKTRSA